MINPGAKFPLISGRSRESSKAVNRATTAYTLFSPRTTRDTQKSLCANWILQKLENTEELPKEETQRLYKAAAAHLSLPVLVPRQNESNKCYLMRARFALKARLSLAKNMVRTARKKVMTGKVRKTGLDAYEEWKTKKQRLETARKIAKEIKDSYAIGEMYCNMEAASSFPEDIFTPNVAAEDMLESGLALPSNRPRTLTSQSGLRMQRNYFNLTTDRSSRKPSYCSSASLVSLKKDKKTLQRAKDKISTIMKTCESIEKSASESERVLSEYADKINKNMEYTHTISKFISKDVLAKLKEKELEHVHSMPDLYDKLTRRHKDMVQNIDEHLDILAKFTKDESQAYLQHKKEASSSYEAQLIRYARDSHKRQAHKQRNVRNSQYLIYADRVVSTVLPNK